MTHDDLLHNMACLRRINGVEGRLPRGFSGQIFIKVGVFEDLETPKDSLFQGFSVPVCASAELDHPNVPTPPAEFLQGEHSKEKPVKRTVLKIGAIAAKRGDTDCQQASTARHGHVIQLASGKKCLSKGRPRGLGV